jgi:hypothetical protein
MLRCKQKTSKAEISKDVTGDVAAAAPVGLIAGFVRLNATIHVLILVPSTTVDLFNPITKPLC